MKIGGFQQSEIGLRLAAVVGSSVAGVNLYPTAVTATKIGVDFSQDAMQHGLDEIRLFVDIVGIKYVAAQPVIIAIIDADELNNDYLITLAERFATAIYRLVAVSGRIGGVGRGQHKFGAARLPVWGIFMPVFLDHARASNFGKEAQSKCKNFGFGKKNIVLTWVFDVSVKVINRHSGAPFLGFGSLLNTDKLVHDVFRT